MLDGKPYVDKEGRADPPITEFQFPDGIENIAAFVSAWEASGHTLTYFGQGWANEPADWWDQVYLYLALKNQVEKERVEGLKDASGRAYLDYEVD